MIFGQESLRCDCETPVDRLAVARCSGEATDCGVVTADAVDVGSFLARAINRTLSIH